MAEELKDKLEDLAIDSGSESEEEVHTEEEEEVPIQEDDEKSASSGESSSEDEGSADGSDSEEEAASEASGRISENEEEESDTESQNSQQQPPAVAKAPARRRKRRNPNKWVKEVNYYQKTTDLLIPKQPFRRLVREIAETYAYELRFTEASFEALQTASEEYLVQMFEDSQLQAISRGQDTIMPKDMQMVMKMKRQRLW